MKKISEKIKVLVTGTRGFIAKELVRYLRNLDILVYEADIIDRDGSINLCKEYSLSEYNVICHLGASSKRSDSVSEIINKNIYVTERLFAKASKFNDLKVIFVSANSIVSAKSQALIDMATPASANELYSCSKLIGESLLLNYVGRKRSSIIRLPAVYGKHNNKEGLINRFIELSKNNENLFVSDLDCQFNNAILIRNVIEFLSKVIFDIENAIGKDFLVAAPDHISIKQIAKRVISNLNSKSNIEIIGNNNFKNLNYLIDNTAALEFGLKSENMLEIIDTVCESK